ncbi:MAG: hypothetical protein VZR36_00280 [Prevotella sp.]|nr:hypothetical protein [Prevotella sp.]
MEKKIYSKPVAEYLRLNTKEDVMIDFPFFTQSVEDGLGKKNDIVVPDEDDGEEMENDSVKYTPSYKRYKPFEDWKGTVLDW